MDLLRRVDLAEITSRLLLATHHGLARAFRCQLFVGVRRLELEVREIHGQDAALVEAECAQSDVVPAVSLKHERIAFVRITMRSGGTRSQEWEGRAERTEGSFLPQRTGLGTNRRRFSVLVSAGRLWKISSGTYRSAAIVRISITRDCACPRNIPRITFLEGSLAAAGRLNNCRRRLQNR